MRIKQYKLVVALGIVCAISQWSKSASAQVDLDSNVNDVVQTTAGFAGSIRYIGPFRDGILDIVVATGTTKEYGVTTRTSLRNVALTKELLMRVGSRTGSHCSNTDWHYDE